MKTISVWNSKISICVYLALLFISFYFYSGLHGNCFAASYNTDNNSQYAQLKSQEVRTDILKLWDNYYNFKRLGKRDEFEKSLREIVTLQLKAGILNQDILSTALVLDANEEIEKNNISNGFLILKYAKEISPEYSLPHFATAKALILNKPLNLAAWTGEIFYGLRKKVTRFRNLLTWLSFLLLVFFLSITLFFSIFVLLQIIKNSVLLNHNIAEFSPKSTTAKFLTVILIFFPFFTLSVFWIIFCEIIIFFRYMSCKEKIIAFTFFLFTIFAPHIIHSGTRIFLSEGREDFNILLKAVEKSWYPGILGDLKRISQISGNSKISKDPVYRFLYALSAKKEGKFDEALPILKSLETEHFEPYNVLINMGNIYFAQKDFSMAVDSYNKAKAYREKPLLAFYNTSKAFSSSFLLDKAFTTYSSAMAINAEKVKKYDKTSEIVSHNTTVVDAYLPFKHLFPMFLSFSHEEDKKTEKIISTYLFRWAVFDNYWLPPLFGVILCLIWGFNLWGVNPGICGRCGKVICDKCSNHLPEGFCDGCFMIWRKNNRVRSMVNKSFKTDSRKKHYIFYIIYFPGVGHLFVGNILSALLIIFLFVLFVMGFVFQNLLSGVYIVDLGVSKIIWGCLLTLFSVFYFKTVVNIVRCRMEEIPWLLKAP